MIDVERIARRIRQHPLVKRLPVWGAVRPMYDAAMSLLYGRRGVLRVMNGTDSLRLHPRWRKIQEGYEPEGWRRMMGDVRSGDTCVDVGAFIGLYTIAMSRRVGPHGKVIAFEPDAANRRWLQHHLRLNGVREAVRVVPAAAGSHRGRIGFAGGEHSLSRVQASSDASTMVDVVPLDEILADEAVHLLKLDVEGYEQHVLDGARALLSDRQRAPRVIYIEVHPHLWTDLGTTGASLLGRLREFGYRVEHLDGRPAHEITSYGEIVAIRGNGRGSALSPSAPREVP